MPDAYTIPADAGATIQRVNDLATWPTSELQTRGRNTRSIAEARRIQRELMRRDDLRWDGVQDALFGTHGETQDGLF